MCQHATFMENFKNWEIQAGRMYICHADTIVSKSYSQAINCALKYFQITCVAY
jgi:hypothetical protein